MDGNFKTIVIGLIFFLFCGVACYFAGRVKGRRIGWERGYEAGFAAGYAQPHPADTTERLDTIYIDRPVEVVRWRDRVEYLAVTDTIRVADSVFVAVPIEVKQYEDSTYRAQVSGWRPSLDWIEVYQRTTTITEYLPPKPEPRKVRVSVGVTAGFGVVLKDGKAQAGPGAAAGLTIAF